MFKSGSMNIFWSQLRWKSGKQNWTVKLNNSKVKRALEAFDDLYGSVYGSHWRNMRAALLTEHKYIALVNNFGDSEMTGNALELDGAMNIKSLINIRKHNEVLKKKKNLSSKLERIDEKIQSITRRQINRENCSIYPEHKSNITEYLSDRNTLEENNFEEYLLQNKKRLLDPGLTSNGLYEYIPANTIKGMNNWIFDSDHYKYYQNSQDFPLRIEEDDIFVLPKNLNIYTHEIGNCSEFKAPYRCSTGVLSHFLMDGSSILPPLFLNVKHGEKVLDACAAPGGKSLVLLQTLHPKVLVCNDIQLSRVYRLRQILKDYLFNFMDHWEGKNVYITQSDARNISEYDSFDKIIVDVPCTTDRHSLTQELNNIFKPSRIKERLMLPELQAHILTNCIRLLRPGGSLVYSTCTLSPIQNDGVVQMALHRAFTDHKITTTIKDLSSSIDLFRDIFRFESVQNLKYGQLIIPNLDANFGPMYFSKISRNT